MMRGLFAVRPCSKLFAELISNPTLNLDDTGQHCQCNVTFFWFFYLVGYHGKTSWDYSELLHFNSQNQELNPMKWPVPDFSRLNKYYTHRRSWRMKNLFSFSLFAFWNSTYIYIVIAFQRGTLYSGVSFHDIDSAKV